MAKVFICYRRADTGYKPEKIKGYLEKYLGRDVVFYDHHIPSGINFKDKLQKKIEGSQVMLVLIGNKWLTDDESRKRLFEEDDFVRYEIEQGLQKVQKDPSFKIIPILFGGVAMPAAGQLPDTIKPLSDYQAFPVNTNEFETRLALLRKNLCIDLKGKPHYYRKRYGVYILSSFIFILLAILSVILISDKPRCAEHTGRADINITFSPTQDGKKIHDQQWQGMQRAFVENLKPFLVSVNSFKGKYHKADHSDLLTKAGYCNADVYIFGDKNDFQFNILHPKIREYFITEFAENFDQISRANSPMDQFACLLKTFLVSSRPGINANLIACLDLISTVGEQTKMEQAILQTTADTYLRHGNPDSALILMKLIQDGGLNPQIVFSRQEMAAVQVGNYNEAVIANTNLINVSPAVRRDSLLMRRAGHFENLREYDKAKSDLEEVKRNNPDKPELNLEIDRLDLLMRDRSNFRPPQSAIPGGSTLVPEGNQNIGSIIEELNFHRQNNNHSAIDGLFSNHSRLFATNPTLRAEQLRIGIERGQVSPDTIPQELLRHSPQLERTVSLHKLQLRPVGN